MSETLEATGDAASAEERKAFDLLERKPIRAREMAQRILQQRPQAVVARFVLAAALHYSEADFPRALYHLRQALHSFEDRYGKKPTPMQPWRWHARMLREQAALHGDLEEHEARLQSIRRYNTLYEPDMLAERAWSLMKLRRFEAARRAAEEGLVSGESRQQEMALNALCAIEFEAGQDRKSYRACRKALEYSEIERGQASAVDLTNFAEASRSLFKLDEAERILLQATKAPLAWYGNPWLELGELYTREARLPEAWHALKQIHKYRSRRPPHVQNADRNETWRGLAAFLLAAGYPEGALQMTDKALVMPDRRGHNSRNPAQDRAIIALIDHSARRAKAERLLERAAALPWYARAVPWLQASWLRFQAWVSRKRAARWLTSDADLVGVLRIGTAQSAVMPPWLLGELVDAVGPTTLEAALRRAARLERRPGAQAYYQAVRTEVALMQGEPGRALRHSARALEGLNPAEKMLRARVHALAGQSAAKLGKARRALAHFDKAFQLDAGVLRRLGIELPVAQIQARSSADKARAAALLRSPRFTQSAPGLQLTVRDDGKRLQAELRGPRGQVWAKAEVRRKRSQRAEVWAAQSVELQHRLFSPAIDLAQADIHSLDGSNRVSRNPGRDLFGMDGM
ncbi:MAG: hypothetical protein ACPGUV_11565 [Polyangiales bacterium]